MNELKHFLNLIIWISFYALYSYSLKIALLSGITGFLILATYEGVSEQTKNTLSIGSLLFFILMNIFYYLPEYNFISQYSVIYGHLVISGLALLSIIIKRPFTYPKLQNASESERKKAYKTSSIWCVAFFLMFISSLIISNCFKENTTQLTLEWTIPFMIAGIATFVTIRVNN